MNDVNIVVREIKKTDMPVVIELLQSMSEFKPAETEYTRIWDGFVQQANAYSIVAIIKDTVVGYGSVVIGKNIRGGKIGHIEDIVSHSNYRQKGIGKTIVEALFDKAKADGCYKVALQCSENNIKFYEKCNYKHNGVSMQRFIN